MIIYVLLARLGRVVTLGLTGQQHSVRAVACRGRRGAVATAVALSMRYSLATQLASLISVLVSVTAEEKKIHNLGNG